MGGGKRSDRNDWTASEGGFDEEHDVHVKSKLCTDAQGETASFSITCTVLCVSLCCLHKLNKLNSRPPPRSKSFSRIAFQAFSIKTTLLIGSLQS